MELYIQLAFAAVIFHLHLILSQFTKISNLSDFNDNLFYSRILFQIFTPTLVYLSICDNLFFPISFLFINFFTWLCIVFFDINFNFNYFFKDLKFNTELFGFFNIPVFLLLGIVAINFLSMLVTNVIFGGPGGLPAYTEVEVDLLNLPDEELKEGSDNTSQSKKEGKSIKAKVIPKKSRKDSKKKVEPNPSTSSETEQKSEILVLQSIPNISTIYKSLGRLKLALVDTLISVYLLLTYDRIFPSLKLYTYTQSKLPLIGNLSSKALEIGFIQLIIFNLYRQLESTILAKLTFYFKTKKQLINHLFYLELLPLIMYSIELLFMYNNINHHKLKLSLMNQVSIPIGILIIKLIWKRPSQVILNINSSNSNSE